MRLHSGEVTVWCGMSEMASWPLADSYIYSMHTHTCNKTCLYLDVIDRLCGLVVSVADYKHRDPGFDSRALRRIFLRELFLERGPLSLVIG
jgi:hypothetical protein